ncbi:MAG: ABC transporter ATP-binding protein [Firmicutes bacterium]|nr:ABC transporter ATP-binding protein [Bacillota bacterium]
MKKPIIEFKNFSYQYRVQAEPTLHDINLTIYEGEKILIVGPSGCGKSTLGNCLNGLNPYSYTGTITGDLIIDGYNTKEHGIFDLSQKIGTVLQDSDGQFIGLTVGEDIAFALENDCMDQEEMFKRVSRISHLVDMDSFIDQAPYELSGGQKQRCALGGVMVNEARILLFDEPLANLDPKTGQVAIELIDQIQKEEKTIVIIEHRLEDVLYRNVDRIIVVNEGTIAMDDTPDKVLASDILVEMGIREPLYLTACKYANVPISEELRPASLETLDMGIVKPYLENWLQENKPEVVETCKDPILEIKDICFSYDGKKTILDHVNANVYRGEMLAIVGKNGAGKSTLSKIITGFETEDSGKLILDGEDLSDFTIKERAEKVGIVLQNPNQMISQTLIYDEIALGLRIRGVSEDEIDKRVTQVMKICGLSSFKKWPISALSYGQKKRVTIASILVLNPKVLILDEPTAGQDYRHYSEIMSFLKSLNENGQTIILITHDMHLMLEYTKRALVLVDSKLVADEDAYEVLCDPELCASANLKETSLFSLATKAGLSDPNQFVHTFIQYDKEVREHEN